MKREPLALEKLQEMVGKPVWIDRLQTPEKSGWEIVKFFDRPRIIGFSDGSYEDARSYGELWLAYAYQPTRIDREAWKPCESCVSCDNCENNADYNPDEVMCGECGLCYGYSNFKPANFCRECGKPLTQEAWAKLEKRLIVDEK